LDTRNPILTHHQLREGERRVKVKKRLKMSVKARGKYLRMM
jgi:hypothetical protein